MILTAHRAPWLLPIATPPIRDGAVVLDERGVVQAVGRASDLSADQIASELVDWITQA
jgi:hypothetical protein